MKKAEVSVTSSKGRTALLVVFLLLASNVPVPAQSPRAPDAELAAGMALVRDGDFEAAVLKLDTVVRRLLADASRSKEAAQAYVYLGVSFLELSQELVARGKFQQALALDPQVRLDPREFSPQQIRVFEAARAEAPPQVASSPSPRPPSTPSPRPSPAASPVAAAQNAPPEEKKKKRSPLLWILGGAAVVGAGAAAAAGGGGGGGAQPTTTTSPVGNTTSTVPTLPPETTTPTTQPGEPPAPSTTTTTSTTQPGTPTTTTSTTFPTSTTTTSTTLPTTTTTSSTTTSTTTTTLPACTYSISATSTPPAFGPLGGLGTCRVTASNASCNWSVGTSDDWITINNGSGSGTDDVRFNVAALPLGPRTGRITLFQGSQPSCVIQQALLIEGQRPAGSLTLTSDLDLDEGRGQVVVDGSTVTFVSRGSQQGAIDATPGAHRVEATVVGAAGRPGTWRFRLVGPVAPGSVRVIAGAAVATGGEELVFRVSGKVGERILFVFRAR